MKWTGSAGWVTTPSTTRATQPYRAIVSTAGTGQPAWPSRSLAAWSSSRRRPLVPFRGIRSSM